MSSASSLHALPDSSYADVTSTLSPSSIAVAEMDSRGALVVLQAVFSLVPSIVGGIHLTSQVNLVGSLPDHCRVGPFDVIDKHLGAWGREAQLIFFILARGSFSLPPFMRMKALYIASLMSEVLKSYNKQTQRGDSWNVDKPKKNGEDVSMGGPH